MEENRNHFKRLQHELINTNLERQKAIKELEIDREKTIYLLINLWRSNVVHIQNESHLLGFDTYKQILITNLINEVEEFISSYSKLTPADKVDVRINQICFETKLHAYIEELNTLL